MTGLIILLILLLACDFTLTQISNSRCRLETFNPPVSGESRIEPISAVITQPAMPKIAIITGLRGTEIKNIWTKLPISNPTARAATFYIVHHANDYGATLKMKKNGIFFGTDLSLGFGNDPKGLNKKILDFIAPCDCIIDLQESRGEDARTIMTTINSAFDYYCLGKLPGFNLNKKNFAGFSGSLLLWAYTHQKSCVRIDTSPDDSLAAREQQIITIVNCVKALYKI